MDKDTALMTVILPVTYIIVDLLRPIPRVPDWALPILSAVTGLGLGLLWAWGQGMTTAEDYIIAGVVGFSFGAGATGVNQIKRQSEGRVSDPES